MGAMGNSALKSLANQLLGEAGSIKTLDIDRAQKRARVVVELKGESIPVEIIVPAYSIESRGAKTRILVSQWNCPSHSWIQILGQRYAPQMDQEIPVPYLVASMVL